MATDVDRVYCEWPHDELLEDVEDSQEESISGILDHGSISFGRYEGESLSWEKWSVFSHNRCQEELEKFKAPGLVAQKKAYFEEYYKKIRALKNLQQDQKDEHGMVSLDSVDADNHSNGTACCTDSDVDYHHGSNIQSCKSNANGFECIHEEQESFFSEMLKEKDEYLTNDEVVDEYEVVEIHLADPDLDESRTFIIDKMATEETNLNDTDKDALKDQEKGPLTTVTNLNDTDKDALKDQEKSPLTTVEPAVKAIPQSEVAEPKRGMDTCKNTKRDEPYKKLNKIELNMKRYKDQTLLLKTSVSGGVAGKMGLHKDAVGHQILDHNPRAPSRVFKQPIQSDKGSDSVIKRITVTSRASKSTQAFPTNITRPSSSIVSKQIKGPSPMKSVAKQNNAKLTSHRNEAATSNTLKMSNVLPVKISIQKPAADTKRNLQDRSQKSRTTHSNNNGVKMTSAELCRPKAICTNDGKQSSRSVLDPKLRSETRTVKVKELKCSPIPQLKETAKNKIQMKEKEKSAMTASKPDKRFTALPLPRFYKNAPSTQTQKQTGARKSFQGGERQRLPVWR